MNLPHGIPKDLADKIGAARVSLEDMLGNARAVKGEGYATLARRMLDFNQIAQLTGVLANPDPPPEVKQLVNAVIKTKMCDIMESLRVALGVPNEDAIEASKLADLMTDQCTLSATRAIRNGPPLQS